MMRYRGLQAKHGLVQAIGFTSDGQPQAQQCLQKRRGALMQMCQMMEDQLSSGSGFTHDLSKSFEMLKIPDDGRVGLRLRSSHKGWM